MRDRGAASGREGFPPWQVLVQPRELCSCGGLPCRVSPLGAGSAILVPSPSPWASAVELPHPCFQGEESQGVKGRYLVLAQHHRLQILHHQHPQLVPNTFCSAQKHLQAQRFKILFLFAAAFMCPCGQTWAS